MAEVALLLFFTLNLAQNLSQSWEMQIDFESFMKIFQSQIQLSDGNDHSSIVSETSIYISHI